MKTIDDAIKAWQWLCDPKNTHEVGGVRVFSVNAFHKAVLRGETKEHVNAVLDLLAGIVGSPIQADLKGTGRSMEARSLDSTERSESELRELLDNSLKSRQEADRQNAANANAAEESTMTDSKLELAIAAFDWFVDPENFELDHRNSPVFSVEKLCRELTVDKAVLEESLILLERNSVIGRPFAEANIRGRKLRPINKTWLERDGRRRLLAILKPEAPSPYVPFGTARVLRTTHYYSGRQLFTAKEGEILSDESKIRALLGAGGVLAKLADVDARMCAAPKCGHRYNSAESPALDYQPLEAIARTQFTPDGGARYVYLAPGDLIADRQMCLTIQRIEWLQPFVRELQPSEYETCPRCQRISKRSAALQKQVA
jgi:hypothetical protein